MVDPVLVTGLATLGVGAVFVVVTLVTWYLVGKWLDLIDEAYPYPPPEEDPFHAE